MPHAESMLAIVYVFFGGAQLGLFLKEFQIVTPSVEASGSIQVDSSALSAPEIMWNSWRAIS